MNTHLFDRSIRSDIIFGITGLAAGALAFVGGRAMWSSLGGPMPAINLAAEARLMGLPMSEGSPVYWYMARSGGMIAYLLLWLSTFWGIAMSSKMMKGLISAPLVYSMHEFFPILAVTFALLHAAALLGDSYINFTLLDILLPFGGPYKPLWTGMGALALYLSLALIISTYMRNRIGRRAWRLLHYSAFVAFVAALVHGVMAGTDASLPIVQWLYLFTGGSVLFATFFRILSIRPKRSRDRIDLRYQLLPATETVVQHLPQGRK